MSKPEWLKSSYPYEDIISSFGYVARYQYFGSYQGDIAVVFRDGNRKGYLIIGYGSCSGCDALEAVRPWCWCDDECTCDWSGVEKLRDSLFRAINWDKEIPDERDENYWWAYDKELYDWIRKNY